MKPANTAIVVLIYTLELTNNIKHSVHGIVHTALLITVKPYWSPPHDGDSKQDYYLCSYTPRKVFITYITWTSVSLSS